MFQHSAIHLESIVPQASLDGTLASLPSVSGTFQAALHHWETADGMDKDNSAGSAAKWASSVVFPAGGRAARKHSFSAQFCRLKSYRWLSQAPEVCAASPDGISFKLQKLFCLSTVQLRTQFHSALRGRTRRGHRIGRARRWGNYFLMFETP